MIVIFTFALLVLLAIGVPVAFSLGASGLLGMVLFMPGDGALEQIPILAYKALDDFVLCAVPLYILMSAILLKGKVGEDLFDLGNKWLRHLPGGLGIATIVACGIFAAITGSSVACAVTVGAIAIPEMLKRGYDRSVVLGAVAGGGTLGILIPPSIPMILYGSITGESIGQLFMSGVLPGVLMTVFFIFIVVYRSRHLKLEKKAPLSERFAALKGSIWGLLLPVIVVGGIYTGAFTPTEAAVISVVYSYVVGRFVYKELDGSSTYKALKDAIVINGATTFMVGLSTAFAALLTMEQIPMKIAGFITSISQNGFVILLLINLLLLLVGMFIDNIPATIILTPILLPICRKFGMSPITFGIMLTMNLAIGFCTPPYGINLFVATAISKVKMEALSKELILLIGALILVLGAVTYIPSVTTIFLK